MSVAECKCLIFLVMQYPLCNVAFHTGSTKILVFFIQSAELNKGTDTGKSSKWHQTFVIPDKRTYSGSVQKAIETGVVTSKARRDMVTVLRTLMLQHTAMPDSIHYNAVCEALVTKFPNLADEEDDSGYVSTYFTVNLSLFTTNIPILIL